MVKCGLQSRAICINFWTTVSWGLQSSAAYN